MCDTGRMKSAKQSFPCFHGIYSLVGGKKIMSKGPVMKCEIPVIPHVHISPSKKKKIPVAPVHGRGDKRENLASASC